MAPSNTTRRVGRPVAGCRLVSTVHDALVGELDSRTLYGILALRSQVFVVEQDCVYLDPDGRDLEPDARQLWIERDGQVVATLRLLVEDPTTVRVGRVATAESGRGRGLARLLVDRALELAAGRAVVLDAQTYLRDWYARLGFVPTGPDFLDDGIPHTPMGRPASAAR
jgi:ElaA protein